jgi:hypothetical protein
MEPLTRRCFAVQLLVPGRSFGTHHCLIAKVCGIKKQQHIINFSKLRFINSPNKNYYIIIINKEIIIFIWGINK